jgi:hypothetical protein
LAQLSRRALVRRQFVSIYCDASFKETVVKVRESARQIVREATRQYLRSLEKGAKTKTILHTSKACTGFSHWTARPRDSESRTSLGGEG